jgi:hypothetical protein
MKEREQIKRERKGEKFKEKRSKKQIGKIWGINVAKSGRVR